jgi:hypothetical protein
VKKNKARKQRAKKHQKQREKRTMKSRNKAHGLPGTAFSEPPAGFDHVPWGERHQTPSEGWDFFPLRTFSDFGHDDTGTPVVDFFKGIDLDEPSDLEECVEDLVLRFKEEYFHQWEAVARHEQGLPLSAQQEEILDSLVNEDDHGERILSIDGMPRPDRPWFEILRRLAPKLVVKDFDAAASYFRVQCEGWPDIRGILEDYTEGLSLPEGVRTPLEIFPEDLRHQLEIQSCLSILNGLGQDEELTLAEEDQIERVEELIDELCFSLESVRYFNLTLDSLLLRITLPPADEKILREEMTRKLSLTSPQQPLAEVITPASVQARI